MMAIDLSAAFDTVDHDILLHVLKNQFGISGSALECHKAVVLVPYFIISPDESGYGMVTHCV